MARNFQLAFWLCVLLLNEFGPANMVRLDAGKHIGKSAVHDKGYKLKDEDQKELQSVNEKEEGKSVIAVIAKAVYKGFKIGAVVIPKLISLASFGNAVFRAIAGCCLDFPEACEGNDKIAKLQEEMREKSLNIDALQLEAQNLQEWTESSRHKFSLLVSGMATIIDNTDVLVRSVSPQAIIAVNNQTVVIKKLVRGKEKIGEKVDLDTVESMYGDAVGSFLDITLPIFELILPTLPKVVKFAAEKFAVRKAQQLNDILKNGLKTPPPNSIKAVRAKGWFAKTKAKINTKINSIKLRIKAKYSNAVSILSKVGKGLSFLFDTLTSGYELYSIIDSALTCKAKRDNVLESLKELKSASKELDDIYYKVKRSKMVIEKAWSTMHRQISSKALTRDLKEMQKILATISEPSSNIKYMSSGIDVYITKIAQTTKSTSPDDIYQLLDDLNTVMGQVPFTIECFDNKVQMVNYIWEECRRGTDTFNNLYQQGIELFDERAKLCKGKIGILHMDSKSIKKTLSEKARTFNFNEDCVLNSELKKGYVCQLKESGYSLGDVAEKAKLTKNQVEFLTKQCPKAEITPTLQNAICSLKKLELSDVKVADVLKLDVNDVRSVKC